MTATDISHKPSESGARLLRYPSKRSFSPSVRPVFTNARWEDFHSDRVTIFIHGFTANSSYLETMMQEFAENGFMVLALNYHSYAGIDRAANQMAELLSELDELGSGVISKKRNVSLVCHSMGGLVARSFISFNGGNRFVRKVITLGTPHDATLTDSQVIRALVSWGEFYTGFTEGGYSSKCPSALQLTMQDDDVEPFLTRLLSAAPVSPDVEFYSISGGRKMLKFGNNFIRNKLVNRFLQYHLGDCVNDGLVKESSSDFSDKKFRGCAPICHEHVGVKAYDRFDETNHSFLISTQLLTVKAMKFAGP